MIDDLCFDLPQDRHHVAEQDSWLGDSQAPTQVSSRSNSFSEKKGKVTPKLKPTLILCGKKRVMETYHQKITPKKSKTVLKAISPGVRRIGKALRKGSKLTPAK